MRIRNILTVSLSALLLSSCAASEEPVIVTETATTTKIVATVTASKSTEPAPSTEQQDNPPAVQEAAPVEQPVEQPMQQEVPSLPPNYSEEQYWRDINKTISHCGIRGIEEVGTTWYTDGTTGWTQHCTDEMMNQVPQQIPNNYHGQPAPVPYQTPEQAYYENGKPVSEWVQGQLEWKACVDAGNTVEYCHTH